MPDYYETDAQLNEYLVFHYASLEQTLPWDFGPRQAFGFHARLAQCIDVAKLPANSRALDLGCAVGRTSFELSRFCSQVIGIDFSHAFIDVNNLARTANFSSDFDGQPFNDYDEALGRELLQQEQIEPYVLVNVVGGKSWRIGRYFVGFFASVNNLLNQEYRTGGFEQGRNTNFRTIKEDRSRENGPLFGNRYFFGSGTTYYINAYVRF